MKTYALFSDKTSSSIEYDFHRVVPNDKELITPYVNVPDKVFKESAKTGIRAVYDILHNVKICSQNFKTKEKLWKF